MKAKITNCPPSSEVSIEHFLHACNVCCVSVVVNIMMLSVCVNCVITGRSKHIPDTERFGVFVCAIKSKHIPDTERFSMCVCVCN